MLRLAALVVLMGACCAEDALAADEQQAVADWARILKIMAVGCHGRGRLPGYRVRLQLCAYAFAGDPIPAREATFTYRGSAIAWYNCRLRFPVDITATA